MTILFYRRIPTETVTTSGEVKLSYALIEREWILWIRRFLQ